MFSKKPLETPVASFGGSQRFERGRKPPLSVKTGDRARIESIIVMDMCVILIQPRSKRIR